MTDRAPERLGAAIAVLVVAAGAVLVCGTPRTTPRSQQFQRLVGGLGWGTATSLVDCNASFDPGISPCCARGLDPLPGGFGFCPHHSGPTIRR